MLQAYFLVFRSYSGPAFSLFTDFSTSIVGAFYMSMGKPKRACSL